MCAGVCGGREIDKGDGRVRGVVGVEVVEVGGQVVVIVEEGQRSL